MGMSRSNPYGFPQGDVVANRYPKPDLVEQALRRILARPDGIRELSRALSYLATQELGLNLPNIGPGTDLGLIVRTACATWREHCGQCKQEHCQHAQDQNDASAFIGQYEALPTLLTERYPLPRRLFGLPADQYGSQAWIFRRLVTNIIVGGNSERQALAASSRLFDCLPGVDYLADAHYPEIRDLFEQEFEIKGADRKAAWIVEAARRIRDEFGGKVPQDRKSLESFRGIGRHVASVVLALAFNKSAFAVDLHVMRIAKRTGMVRNEANEYEAEVTLINLGQHAEVNLGHFSRAFVDHGHAFCQYRPRCSKCPLKSMCNAFQAGGKPPALRREDVM